MDESTKEPLVACVLVNWNSWAHTDRCLRALANQDYRALLVIIVDNGSSDGSLAQLQSAHPSMTFVENGFNAGFSTACNIGARCGVLRGAELIWFLNNDTEAPPETCRKLVEKVQSDKRIGVVGAVLYFMHDPSSVQAWGGGEISLWTGYNRHYTAPTVLGGNSYITFASALVPRRTFEELDGLWEGMFMYFEDSDFCFRARAAGWLLAIAEETAILHAENGSKRTRGRNRRMERIQTRSGICFLARHGVVPLIAVSIFVALRVGKRVVLGEWAALRGVLEGVGDWLRGRITPFRDDA